MATLSFRISNNTCNGFFIKMDSSVLVGVESTTVRGNLDCSYLGLESTFLVLTYTYDSQNILEIRITQRILSSVSFVQLLF